MVPVRCRLSSSSLSSLFCIVMFVKLDASLMARAKSSAVHGYNSFCLWRTQLDMMCCCKMRIESCLKLSLTSIRTFKESLMFDTSYGRQLLILSN